MTSARNRADLLSRWLTLTQDHLPRLAADGAWPIRADHCFMRICLDHAIGQRWDSVVARPAIRNLSDDQLARAVAAAELIARDPSQLQPLNEKSLRARGKSYARRQDSLFRYCI